MIIGTNSLVVCAFACAALAFAFLLALLGRRFFALLSDAFSRMSRPRLAAFLFFAKVDSLTNAWQWIGCEAVSAGETNLDVIVGYDDLHGSTNAPAAAFFRVADRSALAPTMDDADGDGLSDYAEIFVHDTDPWLADSDGDGIADGVEVADGTSPQDLSSFLRHVSVTVVEDDPMAGVTNYVAWGTSASGWEANGMVVAQGQVSTFEFTIASQSGSVYVKAFRDVDRNGVFDPGTDLLVSRLLPARETSTSVTIRFGDLDGDGFADSLELAEGTDPNDARIYCFNLFLVEHGVVGTTNDMTAVVVFGEEVVHGPVVVSNGVFEADVGHLVATNRESVAVYFWDDANSDGMRDDGEFSISRTVAISGHENSVTNDFQAELMDRDRDGMPDWWELANAAAGMSPYTSGDARQDPDGDGLVNLHEYWANCNPLVYDGTNTAIFAAVHSVDDRLDSSGSDGRLSYYSNVNTNLVLFNTNCWAHEINISCLSVFPAEGPATLITRKHFICASHYHLPVGDVYYFADSTGAVHRAVVSRLAQVVGTDLTVGEFSEPLPESITPAKILPVEYSRWFGSGCLVPVIHTDSEKKVSVADIVSLDGDYIIASRPSSTIRDACYEPVDFGDSGHPRFLVLGNEVILLDCVERGPGSPGEGPSVHYYRTDIRQKVASFGDANTWNMTEFDFSCFDELMNIKEK